LQILHIPAPAIMLALETGDVGAAAVKNALKIVPARNTTKPRHMQSRFNVNTCFFMNKSASRKSRRSSSKKPFRVMTHYILEIYTPG